MTTICLLRDVTVTSLGGGGAVTRKVKVHRVRLATLTMSTWAVVHR